MSRLSGRWPSLWRHGRYSCGVSPVPVVQSNGHGSGGPWGVPRSELSKVTRQPGRSRLLFAGS